MWQKVQIDEGDFRSKYEDWLEDEVWTYFDWIKSLRNLIIVNVEACWVCLVHCLNMLQVVDHFLDVAHFGIEIISSKPIRVRARDNLTFDSSPAVKVVF